jgi:hypothetical protein
MCQETIRRAVLQKFEEAKGWKCETIADLQDKIEDKKEANELVNSLKICDPAVGSGHFLVSALNEIIAIKSELDILLDREGKRLKYYHVTVENDELVITDEDGDLFEYHYGNKEQQRIQETLFHEKQTIIENCLFGVDINPNSVKICRLRLWIELLKNSYYKAENVLETLPNIDINIKCGNSLISRFDLDVDIRKALKKSKYSIDAYRVAVHTYRNASDKEEKRAMEQLIHTIKSDFRSEISTNDPKVKQLNKLGAQLFEKYNNNQLFDVKLTAAQKRDRKALNGKIEKLQTDIEDIKNNKIYENAFEWRFEFPEVLDDDGSYVGFDVVIGNPPYISAVNMKRDTTLNSLFKTQYPLVSGTYDVYALFIHKLEDLLKTKGFYSYIIPNKFLVAQYAKKLLNHLEENQSISSSINLGAHNIFAEASVYPIIILGQNKGYNKFQKYIVNDLDLFIKKGTAIEEKTLRVYPTLQESKFKLQGGLAGFQAKSISKYISNDQTEDGIKFTVSGCVDKYIYNNKNVRYMGTKYSSAYITTQAEVSDDKLKFWVEPKIVIAGMTKELEAVYTNEPLALGVGIYGLYNLTEIEGYVITAILNSKFTSHYFKIKFKDKALAGGYLAINKNTLQELPFIFPDEQLANKLEQFSKKIHTLKKEDAAADTTGLEAEIDAMVYALYGLSEEEIKIVEGL